MIDPQLATSPDLDLECVVVEAQRRAPGSYETRTRVFYVDQRGGVFLLQAPGAPITVQQVDDLPEGAHVVARSSPRSSITTPGGRRPRRPDLLATSVLEHRAARRDRSVLP